LKIGDTVRIIPANAVGIVVDKPTKDFYYFKGTRWVVCLASTMKKHIFQEKDMELLT
jgi:ribosomal protein L13